MDEQLPLRGGRGRHYTHPKPYSPGIHSLLVVASPRFYVGYIEVAMKRNYILIPVAALAGAFLLAQAVPYRVQNPAVRQEPAWNSPETRALAERACFDCHSNQVKVPWYGHVAPVAWLVRYHVDEGRSKLNFSEFDLPQEDAHEAAEVVSEGEMPPGYYLTLHAESQLSSSELEQLTAGLQATLGGEGEEEEH